MPPKVLLIYPFTSAHLGLFDDLAAKDDVVLLEAGKKPAGKLGAFFRRIHFSHRINQIIPLPYKEIWYRLPSVHQYRNSLESIIIIDGALNQLPESYMRRLKTRYPKIRFYVYMINAIDAASPIIQKIRPYILQFPWDGIYTFDPEDAKKYNLQYLGFCYYSKHTIEQEIQKAESFDAYFVGGLKGGRNSEILSVYNYLSEHGVKCDFNLMVYGHEVPEGKEGLKYYGCGWRPYGEVLRGVDRCGCIVEILQHGQSGPSLRYFEAVCYNKRLLTNNPHIVNFPYYNPEYMRVFHSPEDIDIDWLKGASASPVQYNYQGEFSPNTLIDFFMNKV